MRMRNKPWARDYLAQSPRAVDARGLRGQWGRAFPNGGGGALHVELGCGMGGFVIQSAAARPDVNFAAIETDRSVLAAAIRAADGLGSLPNLLFADGDAADALEYFADGEADRIYINFCDPWRNRAKWFKRRLTHRGFLAKYRQILSPGGAVFFKTDNEDLFRFSKREFAAEGWRLENVTEDLHNSGFVGNIETEYEKKFAAMGKPIYRLEAFT